jgi:hypothetical protein
MKDRRQTLDNVMKRLWIEIILEGKEVIPLGHYNADGRLVGGGRTSWLTTLRGYALKINLVIDDIK